MSKYTIPDDRQARILRENHIPQEEFAVILDAGDYIVLHCYKTGCLVTTRQGDRKWA